ncbi:MAG: cell division protein SepF [Clostridia bacterium]|nr:cell division protein SepF [Clostridia bacterium]
MKTSCEVTKNGLQGTKDITPYYPRSLGDVEEVLSALKQSEIIVDITHIKSRDKQRFLDLLCGACFCLNKGICTLKTNVYLIIDK